MGVIVAVALAAGLVAVPAVPGAPPPPNPPPRPPPRVTGPAPFRPPAPRVAPPPPVGPPGAASMAARLDPTDTYGSMMGQRPVDPAPVRLPSGEALSIEQLQQFLP